MNPLLFIMLLFVGLGLVTIGIAVPLILRRVKPNYWYGFRTKRTLNNPHIWYEVNAHLGKRLLVSGTITTIAAVGLYFVPGLTADGYVWGMLILAVVPLVIGLSQSFQYLHRLED